MGEINLDSEYFALLDRIMKGAYYLAQPDIAPADYERAIKLYDALCEEARKLRWGRENV